MTGPMADRYGRKPVLMTCIAGFALCTFIITQVQNTTELTVMRFVSALFFSGVLPNCIAMTSEIAPKRLRSGMVGLAFCGYIGGSFLIAWTLAYIVEPFGWQAAYYIGGVLPLLLLPILYFFLPESIRFLATHNPSDPRIARLVKQIDPSQELHPDTHFHLTEPPRKRAAYPVTELFHKGLLATTLLLWLAYATAFFVTQLLTNWQPTVFHMLAGMSYDRVALLLSIGGVGAILGTGTVGFIMDRFGAIRSLSFFFVMSAILLVGLAFVDLNTTFGIVLFTVSGYTMCCGLAGINALATHIYPPRVRVTGLSWAAGVGRIGGMGGPVAGGMLLAGDPSTMKFFLAAGIPELFAGLAVIGMVFFLRPSTPAVEQKG
jgi:AAHS family 4-hydroxybenzoate transporter-like MFS transporter